MTVYSLSFANFFPHAVFYGLILLALAIFGLTLWRRRPSAWLRGIGAALLLFALSGPFIAHEEREPLKDAAILVVDRSGSQTLQERAAQTAAARAELEKRFKALGDIDLRIIESDPNESGGTHLFSALNAGLSDIPIDRLGAVLMLSDGQVADIPKDLAQYGLKAPLHVLISGHEGERDRRIELKEAPRFGIVGKDVVVKARIRDTGADKKPISVRILRDGVELNVMSVQADQELSIPIRIDHGGPNVVEIAVETVPNEVTEINNKAALTIEGARDKLKVLLVSGEPHNGERTWRNLLRSDANVELVHFTILRSPEKQDNTPINELSLIAFPTADLFGRKIKEFDLIIFDRYSNQRILPPAYLENIVRYVRGGGALLLAVGPDFSGKNGIYYSPLGDISPGKPTGELIERPFTPELAPLGERHPVTQALPGSEFQPPHWSDWFRQVAVEARRGDVVLVGADKKPLLILSHEDKGRVAELTSDQIWLWARDYQGGGPYLDLLRRLAHWLMKEPDLEEESLRARVNGRAILVERHTLKETLSPVVVTTPSGAQSELILTQTDPGAPRGQLEPNENGLYRFKQDDLTALVSFGADQSAEFQEVISTPEKFKSLTEETSGSVRRIADSSGRLALPRLASVHEGSMQAGGDWIGVRRNGASLVREKSAAPLALGLGALIVLLAAIIAIWAFEGRKNAA